MTGVRAAGLSLLAGLFLLQACERSPTGSLGQIGDPSPPIALSDSEKKLDHVAICAPTMANFPNPLVSTNPYFPITPGYQWTLEGEEDGEEIEALITVLNETRLIDGILARVIEERESEDGEQVEISWNYYSVNVDGVVCYRGEDVDDIEDDEVVAHEGAWCSDDAENNAGIFMPADPRPGMTFLQEDAPLVPALDGAKVVAAGPGPIQEVFGAPYADAIRLQEFTLIEGRKEKADVKWFGAGTGILIDGSLVLTDFTMAGVDPGDPISMQVCGS
ncbi:MAG: hypothetical protein P8Y29_07345 [Gemmatimonadota bacterium]|jgi:hypothetical protein